MPRASSLRILFCTVAFLVSPRVGDVAAVAQSDARGAPARKQAVAVRLVEGAIRLDGRLDEDAWGDAPPITDFVQRQPDEGQPPTDSMDVRIAYDDEALYNLVLRWEWRAGSSVYLVWQQDRAADEMGGTRATIGDMFGSLGSRGDHFFAVKASYWFSPD